MPAPDVTDRDDADDRLPPVLFDDGLGWARGGCSVLLFSMFLAALVVCVLWGRPLLSAAWKAIN